MKDSYDLSDASGHENSKGLHWLMASVFIVGDLAGGGMIALPYALVNANLVPGLLLMACCAIFFGHTGIQLADNFTMMQRRWQKYRIVCRKPYGEMGYRAIGPWMRTFVAIMICLCQFGFATVLILLAAKNLAILLNFFFAIKVHYCYLILIVGLVVWPATMLKSPMHFWQVAMFSAASSSLAVVLLTIGFIHDAPTCSQEVVFPEFGTQRFFMAYGTMAFAFGGHVAFPTIQHDMKQPLMFRKSIYVGFTAVLIYYVTMSCLGYFVYGQSLGEASIPSVQLQWVQQTVNLMIALHVITTIVIVFSPIVQLVEEGFKISHKFSYQRVIIRSILFWVIVFVALTLPHFGPVMDLMGASTMSITCLILPSLFYLYLTASERKRMDRIERKEISEDDPDEERATVKDIIKYIPLHVLVFNVIIILFGLIGGIIATVSSIIKLTEENMGSPCYIQYFRNGGHLPFVGADDGTVNCCGKFQNITVSGQDAHGYCAAFRE